MALAYPVQQSKDGKFLRNTFLIIYWMKKFKEKKRHDSIKKKCGS